MDNVSGDVALVVQGLAELMFPIQDLITAAAFILGLVFSAQVITGFMALSNRHHGGMMMSHQQKSPGALLTTMLIAATLLNFSFTVSGVIEGLTGQQFDYSMLAAVPSHDFGTPQANALLNCIAIIIMTIGVISIFKGLLLFKKAGDGVGGGGDLIAKGTTHILGGAVATNFFGTLLAIQEQVHVQFHF